jgi:hypothetical protein
MLRAFKAGKPHARREAKAGRVVLDGKKAGQCDLPNRFADIFTDRFIDKFANPFNDQFDDIFANSFTDRCTLLDSNAK